MCPRNQTYHSRESGFGITGSVFCFDIVSPIYPRFLKTGTETHCPVAFERYKSQFVNGPSLQPFQIKESWVSLGKEMLKSYPKGAQCICGKSDWDLGNTNAIAKHLALNPKHHIKVL